MKKRNIIIIAVLVCVIAIFSIIMIIKNKSKIDYTIEQIQEDKYYIYNIDDKYGVIDNQGNVIINATYDNVVIPNTTKDVFFCSTSEQTFIMDDTRATLYLEYECVEPIQLKNIDGKYTYEKSILKYLKDGKYGLINFDGDKITSPLYDKVESFPNKEGILLVSQDSLYGIININGYKLVPCQYTTIKIDDYFDNDEEFKYAGYIVNTKTDDGYRYGYYNYKGNKILEPEFVSITRIDTNQIDSQYLIVQQSGNYGVYLKDNIVIPIKYKSIEYDTYTNTFIVEMSGKFGVVDLNGNQILECNYSQIKTSDNSYYATDEEKTHVFSLKGQEQNKDSSYIIYSTENEDYSIKVMLEDDYGYYLVDKNNNEISKKYSYIKYLVTDKFLATKDGQIGMIDSTGQEVISFDKVSIEIIKNSNMLAIKDDDQNYLNIYSSDLDLVASDISYDYTIKNNILIGSLKDGGKVFIDLQNENLVNCGDAFPNNALYSFYENGYYGFKDRSGNIVVSAIYEDVTELNDYGFAGIKQDGVWGSINSKGEIVQEPYYYINYSNIDFIGKYYKLNYSIGDIVYSQNLIKSSDDIYY